jgi:Cu/Ag efflux protein CusF
MNPDPSQSGGYVVATRSGLLNAPPEQRIIVVEFAGSNLSQPSTIPLTADVKAVDAGADKIKIHDVTVQAMPEDRWRVTFQISPATQGAKLTETGPVEIRCCLKRGENFLTETWVHRVIP